jgi:hypothetical protein
MLSKSCLAPKQEVNGTDKKVYVSIQFDAEEIEVGELVNENKIIYSRYYPSFVKRGLEISPIKLKFNTSSTQTKNNA